VVCSAHLFTYAYGNWSELHRVTEKLYGFSTKRFHIPISVFKFPTWINDFVHGSIKIFKFCCQRSINLINDENVVFS